GPLEVGRARTAHSGSWSVLIRSSRLTARRGPLLLGQEEGGVMRSFQVVVERDPETKVFVGYVPGWPGAHSQGGSLDELMQNLSEVVSMLLEDGEPRLESEFVGTKTLQLA
ncbi:MAG TPA: type II toxin-antitoxin system HicB family antitoxin, partial [Gemmatimonadales bacterium]|nr:type II toxin-antitoxin system HicB family antitoxin [Gemmatimonadales bacterium]